MLTYYWVRWVESLAMKITRFEALKSLFNSYLFRKAQPPRFKAIFMLLLTSRMSAMRHSARFTSKQRKSPRQW